MDRKNGLPPVHPGEILREDIFPEIGLSVTAVAKALGVSRQMLHDILAERRPLSAVMCLKVSRLLGSTPEFWMRLQADYDLKKAAQNKKVMERVAQIVPVKPPSRSPRLTICLVRSITRFAFRGPCEAGPRYVLCCAVPAHLLADDAPESLFPPRVFSLYVFAQR